MDRDAPDAAAPVCVDDSGYQISASDLDFLEIAASDLRDMLAQVRPLGMADADFRWFVSELQFALKQDGIDDADIRLQGSSVRLWSGAHKRLPADRDEVFQILSKGADDFADEWDVDRCLAILEGQWPPGGVRPLRRPFDVMFKTQLDPDPSDYDVQVSSDQMIDRIRLEVERIGVNFDNITVKNSDYEFIEKRYCRRTFPNVTIWKDRALRRLSPDPPGGCGVVSVA